MSKSSFHIKSNQGTTHSRSPWVSIYIQTLGFSSHPLQSIDPIFLEKSIQANGLIMGSRSKIDNPHTGDGASPGFVYLLISFLRKLVNQIDLNLSCPNCVLFGVQEDFYWRIGERHHLW